MEQGLVGGGLRGVRGRFLGLQGLSFFFRVQEFLGGVLGVLGVSWFLGVLGHVGFWGLRAIVWREAQVTQ